MNQSEFPDTYSCGGGGEEKLGAEGILLCSFMSADAVSFTSKKNKKSNTVKVKDL